MRKTFVTRSVKETQVLAATLAKELRGGEVIALEGELGAGKTTFVQGLAKGLGVKEKVLSPTFVLIKFFDLSTSSRRNASRLIHVDCYRLESPQELLKLGWRELLKEKSNVIVIEWAEKVRRILPRSYIRVHFRFKGTNHHEITFEPINE